jgi:ABC-type phosphate transport system substrate-binding protein
MRTKIAVATFLLIGAAATGVGAVVNMQGSDTMNRLTKTVIANCPAIPAGAIVYAGGGSGAGEANMSKTALGTSTDPQTTAPMSRYLKAAGATATCVVASGNRAEGVAVALDGVSVVASATRSAGCGGVSRTKAISGITDVDGFGLACPGCVGTTYTPNSPFDVMKVLWYGIHHDGTRDCGSDVRRTLSRSYNNLFETTCASGCVDATIQATDPAAPNFTPRGTQTNGLLHVWRRDDVSGTTDTFNTLVGGTIAQFCNVGTAAIVAAQGSDYLENDPIRVTCGGNGKAGANGPQICGDGAVKGTCRAARKACTTAAQCNAGDSCTAGRCVATAAACNQNSDCTAIAAADVCDGVHLRTLGLVLPVFIPDNNQIPDAYPAGVCGTSAKLFAATSPTFSGMCPAGNLSFGGKCFQNVLPVGTGFNANCVQIFAPAGACPPLVPAGRECRGANMWLRKTDGTFQKDLSFAASLPAGRNVTSSAFKMYATSFESNGTAPCADPSSSTEQIGCFSATAAPCSVGFAGRSAGDSGAAVGLAINGISPTVPNIQSGVYPLTRKLYFNAINGFENAQADELSLARCFSNDTLMSGGLVDPPPPPPLPPGLIWSEGFVPLPTTVDVNGAQHRAFCQDFREDRGVGLLPDPALAGCGAANVDACAGNPPGIATERPGNPGADQ